MSRKVLKQHRWYIVARFNKKCGYCGENIEANTMQIDHYYPISKQVHYTSLCINIHDFKNLIPSCSHCNQIKGCLSPEAFRYKFTGSAIGTFYFEDYLEGIKHTIPFKCIYPQKHKELI